jgi:hypothetical protein
MKEVLCMIANYLSEQVIGKPIFTFDRSTIIPIHNNYYRLNHEINTILSESDNLQHLNNLSFGESTKD